MLKCRPGTFASTILMVSLLSTLQKEVFCLCDLLHSCLCLLRLSVQQWLADLGRDGLTAVRRWLLGNPPKYFFSGFSTLSHVYSFSVSMRDDLRFATSSFSTSCFCPGSPSVHFSVLAVSLCMQVKISSRKIILFLYGFALC